jgi:dTDP-4-amino-4,6-dideoxygalactose transaminase
MIPVTKPYLPVRSEYQAYLNQIWESNWLTNNGPLLLQLEKTIPAYLDSVPMSYVTNGTIALQLAIKALEIKGEVITTPYSYVATTSSILWEHCKPVFVDCLSDGNINPSLIEASITKHTSAILATHVYGFPCDVDAIQAVAEKYGLKVIYDAAHAFGVKYKGQSIYNFGDISTASFHATKLFHTVEGGGIFTAQSELIERLNLLRSFGHRGDEHVMLGINGKQSEFHAAMGLTVLIHINQIIAERKLLYNRYQKELADLLSFVHPVQSNFEWNFAYAPILMPSESDLLEFVNYMLQQGIALRRYFYPALNQLPYINGAAVCPVAENISSRVLALPIFNGLTNDEQTYIIQKIGEWRS